MTSESPGLLDELFLFECVLNDVPGARGICGAPARTGLAEASVSEIDCPNVHGWGSQGASEQWPESDRERAVTAAPDHMPASRRVAR